MLPWDAADAKGADQPTVPERSCKSKDHGPLGEPAPSSALGLEFLANTWAAIPAQCRLPSAVIAVTETVSSP